MGGTATTNRRYTSKDPNPRVDTEDEFQLVTSVNDMIEYLETAYTSKITNHFVADVKTTVMSILREINAKAEIEDRKRKDAEKLAKVGAFSILHDGLTISVSGCFN